MNKSILCLFVIASLVAISYALPEEEHSEHRSSASASIGALEDSFAGSGKTVEAEDEAARAKRAFINVNIGGRGRGGYGGYGGGRRGGYYGGGYRRRYRGGYGGYGGYGGGYGGYGGYGR